MEAQFEFTLGVNKYLSKPERVTLESAEAWYQLWSTSNDISDYEVYIVGSFVEQEYGVYDGLVYDLDVVLVGNIKDEQELKVLLDSAITCGIEVGVMIDVWHNDKLMDLNSNKEITQTRSYNRFITKSTFGDLVENYDYPLWGGNGVELSSGLFQFTYEQDKPAKSWIKANDRVRKGKYKGLQMKATKLLEK